jgi:ubiquitin carboxyl-terminal hydrolase 25/28
VRALFLYIRIVGLEHRRAHRLFYGRRKQRIIPESDAGERAPTIHEREDPFFQLPINVSDEGCDLYDGLAGYFADATVELDKRPARMETAIADLPPILQIQLQRAQFDRESLMSYKSQAYVRFGETLFMDRFLDAASVDKKERSKRVQAELGTVRERIHHLTVGKVRTSSAGTRAVLMRVVCRMRRTGLR